MLNNFHLYAITGTPTLNQHILFYGRLARLQRKAVIICAYLFITVARDSGRPLYFGRVIFFNFFLFFYFFFRPPNFRRPWADFHETLPHDAVCAEIVYLL